MTRVVVVSVVGARLRRTVESVRGERRVDIDHRIVRDLRTGFADAAGSYGVVLAAGSTLTSGFLGEAAALLDREPTVGLVAPGKPTPNGNLEFDLGAHLIRDGLPAATMFRVDEVEFDAELGSLALWDAWLTVIGRGGSVRILKQHRQRNAPPPPDADDEQLQVIMTRHLELYTHAAEEFWHAVLTQRTRLMSLKSRYGKIEDALHRIADTVRRRR